MHDLKVMTVFGTRPEAVKMAPLVRELERREGIKSIVCVTAQHRQMLDQMLNVYGIKPDYDLNIMQHGQTLSDVTSRVLMNMDAVLDEVQPDIVLVQGDTTTVLSGALSAFYHKIPVGHVEAGLRTGDIYSPFPEEANRRLVGTIAALHFAPTAANAENLRRENVLGSVYITGNTVIDAIRLTVRDNYSFRSPELAALDTAKKVILITAHRRENYGEAMENIGIALRDLALRFPDTQLVLPVHKAPYVTELMHRYLSGIDNVLLCEPLDPDDMHNLMACCHLVLTDSGGLQEEAPSLGKPVLVMRRETERPEAAEAGTVRLVGVAYDDILSAATELLTNSAAYSKMANAVNPYGDGGASSRIVDAILHHFGRGDMPRSFTP